MLASLLLQDYLIGRNGTVFLVAGERKEKDVFGPEGEWRSRHAVFACGYGHKLTLDSRADEEVLAAS